MTHRSRSKGEESLYVLDAETNACLHYTPIELFPKKLKADIPLEHIKGHSNIQLRSDLQDVQIDICTLEVPALFTENFDYQDIRKDFVRGVLESDLLGKTIYCKILKGEYAVRVKNTFMYNSVSKDVLRRWAYPLVPESKMLSADDCVLVGTNLYKERKVQISRSAPFYHPLSYIFRSTILKGHNLIGANSVIAEKAHIKNSVIGKNCRIGSGAVIVDSYIWDNTEVKSGANLKSCIAGKNVVIKENALLLEGCLLGENVSSHLVCLLWLIS